jgi:hypothetical protein
LRSGAAYAIAWYQKGLDLDCMTFRRGKIAALVGDWWNSSAREAVSKTENAMLSSKQVVRVVLAFILAVSYLFFAFTAPAENDAESDRNRSGS